MSEYWKSTPKYWCKFCSVYVRDTKLERTQHEATGRHQGNIQRSLKGLHRDQQAEERKKEQAKNEVARLNGLVPNSGSSTTTAAAVSSDGRAGAKPTFTRANDKQASLEDRKRQLDQLVAMGISVPQEIRGDVAMAGEWQVVSEKVIGDDREEKKLNKGVHKRKLDEDEREQVAAGEIITRKKGWGQTFKSFPGKMGGDGDEDVEKLFKKVKRKGGKLEDSREMEVKREEEIKEETDVKEEGEQSALQDIPTEEAAAAQASRTEGDALAKEDEDAPAPAVVFKKRKKIAR